MGVSGGGFWWGFLVGVFDGGLLGERCFGVFLLDESVCIGWSVFWGWGVFRGELLGIFQEEVVGCFY